MFTSLVRWSYVSWLEFCIAALFTIWTIFPTIVYFAMMLISKSNYPAWWLCVCVYQVMHPKEVPVEEEVSVDGMTFKVCF